MSCWLTFIAEFKLYIVVWNQILNLICFLFSFYIPLNLQLFMYLVFGANYQWLGTQAVNLLDWYWREYSHHLKASSYMMNDVLNIKSLQRIIWLQNILDYCHRPHSQLEIAKYQTKSFPKMFLVRSVIPGFWVYGLIFFVSLFISWREVQNHIENKLDNLLY